MGGLVAEDGEAGEGRAHEEEGGDVGRAGGRSTRRGRSCRGPGPRWRSRCRRCGGRRSAAARRGSRARACRWPVSRSVGRTSGSTSSGGTIVVRGSSTSAMPIPYTLSDRCRQSVTPRSPPGRCSPRSSSAPIAPWLPTRRLVRTAELFGISEGTARTALSRMVDGRRGRGRSRAATGWPVGSPPARTARRPAAAPPPARGTAPGSSPSSTATAAGPRPTGPRSATRCRQLRLVELREGVWAPARQPRPRPHPGRGRGGRRVVPRWRGARPDADARRRRAVRDLGDWADRAEELRGGDGRAARPARGRRPRRAGRRASSPRPPCSATSRPTRSCPPSCCPTDWPGDALRHDYDRYDTRLPRRAPRLARRGHLTGWRVRLASRRWPTTASTSASCSPVGTSPRTDPMARQMVNFVYLIGDRETGEAVVIDPAYDIAGHPRRARGRTACASPARSPRTTTRTTWAGPWAASPSRASTSCSPPSSVPSTCRPTRRRGCCGSRTSPRPTSCSTPAATP